VRAFDREENQSREIEFRKTLNDVYRHSASPFLDALLTLAERERRFARRFRSWRRAQAARAAAPQITSPPSGSRPGRKAR
jgi:hypothetical protein